MTKKTKILTLTLATGAMLVGGAAIAQTQNERGPMTRDAVIERTEARFAKMDANGDGVLNAEDRAARVAATFAEMDTDNNGVLSEAEFTAAHEARMERRKERREARAERRGDRQMRRGGRGGRGGGEAMLKRADTNGDGQITQAEMQTAALARFDRVDANSDGTITRDERRAARQAMRSQRRGQ